MRVASFHFRQQPCYGVVSAAGVRPAPPAFQVRFPDLKSVLAAGALGELAIAVQDSAPLDINLLQFAMPIPDPARIICIGVNYLEHIHEMGRKRPAYPSLFTRFNDTMVGHGRPVVRPRISTEYDYEGELAVVIGRTARYLSEADALAHVAGYTCFFDGSVRDWQNHTTQFSPGKNFPASGSCGPWLVTTDEMPDLSQARLQTRVNAEVLQSAPLSDLCFGVAQIVAYCSGFCQLNPGDIIATGTPSGVGFARKPPRWLKAGDRIEVEIDGIGVLANTVVDE